jgi:hypothetical protein
MPIDFPNTPTVGQQYAYGGVIYVYTAAGVWSTLTVAYAPLASPAFVGMPSAPTPSPIFDESQRIATSGFAWGVARNIVQAPIGVTDGSTVAAGRVGQVMEQEALNVLTGPNAYVTSTFLALPAGEWLLDAMVMHHYTGTSPAASTSRAMISDVTNAPPSLAMRPPISGVYTGTQIYASVLAFAVGQYTQTVRHITRQAAPKTFYCVTWHNAPSTTAVTSHFTGRRIR